MSDMESTWQPAHPPARTSDTRTGGHQPAEKVTSTSAPVRTSARTSGALVTHQVVIGTGESGLADLAHQVDDEAHQEGWLAAALAVPRFVNESPGSLRDQIEFAEEGAYSSRTDGWWRTANIWYARSVAFVGLTVCYLLAWALFTRLSRMLTAIPIILFALWALNQFPITAWAIPDSLDFTTWFAPGTDAGVCSAPGLGG